MGVSWGESGPRVLVADDDAATRDLLRRVLEEEGMAVVGEATDGRAAAQQVGKLRADVVLMDLRMPGVGGMEATRLIKQSHPLVQVLVLTAYEGPHPSRSAEKAGAYAYLVKGCSARLIREMILQAWRYKAALERRHPQRSAAGDKPVTG